MNNKSKEHSKSIAIYPGSFDPIHNGHIDIIRRSVTLFDEVIVAVAYNPHKDSALFSPDERVEMIRECIKDLEPRARVDKFSGLSVDYAERIGAAVIIRSLRAVTDFDYELQMAQMNRGLAGGEIRGHAEERQLQILDMRLAKLGSQQAIHPAPRDERQERQRVISQRVRGDERSMHPFLHLCVGPPGSPSSADDRANAGCSYRIYR